MYLSNIIYSSMFIILKRNEWNLPYHWTMLSPVFIYRLQRHLCPSLDFKYYFYTVIALVCSFCYVVEPFIMLIAWDNTMYYSNLRWLYFSLPWFWFIMLIDSDCYTKWDCISQCCRYTLKEESNQTNVILQYKLLASILSTVCSVIQQS